MEKRTLTEVEERVASLASSISNINEAWQNFATHYPKDIVLSDTLGGRLTRAEVDEQSGRINAYLRAQGIGAEDVVLVRVDRSVRSVVAALGVWKAGATLCLLESDYAPDRVAFIREDSGAKCEISEENWQEVLAGAPETGAPGSGAPGVDTRAIATPDDHDACVLVYTSGTTGTPKGVMHEYGQLKMEILSETQENGSIRQSRKTRWALGAPLNFVASLKILVHFVYSGGHLYILDPETLRNPHKLDAYFLTNRINETFLSPSLLRTKNGSLGPFVKIVYCGAEPVDNVSLKHGTLVNNYSMTESLFTVCDFIIDHPYERCPIGKPAFDLGIRLLDESGNEVAPGQVGEISFPNPFLRGYTNRPEENGKKFQNGYFRSKDMASFEDGVYAIRGRGDDMVKINGNRIEPLEIEKVFTRITGIECVVKGFAEGQDGFVALYYVDDTASKGAASKKGAASSSDAQGLDIEKVRARMEETLPYYMVPSCFVPIDKIPRTPLGKTDRKVLKRPRIKRAPYVEPVGEIETAIAEAAAKSLGLARVGRTEDLFQLGCTSIDIIEILTTVDRTGLSADMFYRGKTVEAVAAIFAEETGEGMAAGMTEEEMELEGRKHEYILRDAAFILYYLTKVAPDQTDTVNLAQAFTLSRLISLEKMRDAINEYTSKSSTFQTVLTEDGEGNAYYKYAPELYRPVEIERMSEREAEELAANFVQPFKLTEELPWRVRLVHTSRKNYLFFDIHHVLTDGEGLQLIAAGILDVYQGKQPRPNNFFAWLYREEQLYNSRYFEECKQKMHNRFDNTDWAQQPHEVNEEIGLRSKEYDTGVSFEELNAYLRANNRSRGDLFIGALVLAMHEATGGNDITVGAAYANRTGVENVAGARVRTLTYGFDMRDMVDDAEEYLDMVDGEIREGIATACYCYRYRKEGFDAFNPIVDDLEDLEEMHPMLKRFATPVDLGRNFGDGNDDNTEPSAMTVVLNYLNKDGRLLIRAKRDVHWLSDESRDKFIEQNIAALHRLMAGGKIMQ